MTNLHLPRPTTETMYVIEFRRGTYRLYTQKTWNESKTAIFTGTQDVITEKNSTPQQDRQLLFFTIRESYGDHAKAIRIETDGDTPRAFVTIAPTEGSP